MLRYQHVGITVKSDLDERDGAVRAILNILRTLGVEICMDAKRCQDLPSAKGVPTFTREEGIDLLLVIGGDGTILRVVRELQDFSIPILSINRGGIGFLAEADLREAETLLPKLLSGEGVLDERSALHIEAVRNGNVLTMGVVLNEAVIAQGSIARLIDLATSINDEALTTFRADGLIIATPSGSTAYSLAAGGPVVHPPLRATILTPINSHSFSQKPIVIPGNHRIEVEVLTKESKFHDTEVTLTFDGQTFTRLQAHDRVRTAVHQDTVKFIRRAEDTFYGVLRRKLKWGE